MSELQNSLRVGMLPSQNEINTCKAQCIELLYNNCQFAVHFLNSNNMYWFD